MSLLQASSSTCGVVLDIYKKAAGETCKRSQHAPDQLSEERVNELTVPWGVWGGGKWGVWTALNCSPQSYQGLSSVRIRRFEIGELGLAAFVFKTKYLIKGDVV